MENKTYLLSQSDFDKAFKETMLYFLDKELVDDKILDEVFPLLLGWFEAAVQDRSKNKSISNINIFPIDDEVRSFFY